MLAVTANLLDAGKLIAALAGKLPEGHPGGEVPLAYVFTDPNAVPATSDGPVILVVPNTAELECLRDRDPILVRRLTEQPKGGGIVNAFGNNVIAAQRIKELIRVSPQPRLSLKFMP